MVQVRGKANFCQGIVSRCGGQERIEVASWRIENSESRFHATLGEQLEEERLLLEEVFEGLAGVRVAGRSTRRRRTSSRRLSIRSWRGIFFDGHAKFVEGAVVLGILGSDAFLDRLGALELRAGIEEAALFAAVQFSLALRTRAVGIESRSQDGIALRTSRARNGTDHARRTWAELIGAPRPAGRRRTVVRLIFFLVLFRVAVAAHAVLSIQT